MKFLAVILLSLALILEASLTTIPFILLVLLCLMVLTRESWLFALAFVFGLLLDLLTFKTLGFSSAFLTAILFLVLLYQSKFEIIGQIYVFDYSDDEHKLIVNYPTGIAITVTSHQKLTQQEIQSYFENMYVPDKNKTPANVRATDGKKVLK